MNKYSPLIFVIVLTGLTSPAVAGTFNYTSVSAEYSIYSSAIDGFSEDFEGNRKSLDLSLALRPNLALIARYSTASANMNLSGTIADVDITSTTFGLTGHLAVNDTTDFVIMMSFINGKADVDVDGTYYRRVDADGGLAAIGLKKMAFDALELNGFVYKKTIEETTNIGVSLAAAYYISKSVSLDLAYSFDADSELLALALTKYF